MPFRVCGTPVRVCGGPVHQSYFKPTPQARAVVWCTRLPSGRRCAAPAHDTACAELVDPLCGITGCMSWDINDSLQLRAGFVSAAAASPAPAQSPAPPLRIAWHQSHQWLCVIQPKLTPSSPPISMLRAAGLTASDEVLTSGRRRTRRAAPARPGRGTLHGESPAPASALSVCAC